MTVMWRPVAALRLKFYSCNSLPFILYLYTFGDVSVCMYKYSIILWYISYPPYISLSLQHYSHPILTCPSYIINIPCVYPFLQYHSDLNRGVFSSPPACGISVAAKLSPNIPYPTLSISLPPILLKCLCLRHRCVFL